MGLFVIFFLFLWVFVEFLGEKGEIYFAVGAVLPEMGMLFERELARVFEY